MRKPKIRVAAFCLLVAVALAAGCQREAPASDKDGEGQGNSRENGAAAGQNTAPPSQLTLTPITPQNPEAVVFYEYREGGYGRGPVYLPHTAETAAGLSGSYFTAKLDVLLGLSPTRLEVGRDGPEAVVIIDQDEPLTEEWAAAIHSIQATILHNAPDITQVRVLQGDVPLRDEALPLDAQGVYHSLEEPEIAETAETLTRLRQMIPYQASERLPALPLTPSQQEGGCLLKGDPVAAMLEEYLSMVTTGFGIPRENFSGFEGPEGQVIAIKAAGLHTHSYPLAGYGEHGEDQQELEAIGRAAPYPQILLREHVEQTAELLFGPAFRFSPEQYPGELFGYDPHGGVFYPTALDDHITHIPVVLDYWETADDYKATVVYLCQYPDDDRYIDLFGNPWPEEGLEEMCRIHLPKREVTITKGEGGALYLYSHQFMGPPLQANSVSHMVREALTNTDTLLCAASYDSDPWEGMASATSYPPDRVVLSNGKSWFWLMPIYRDSTLRIDALDQQGETIAVQQLVYTHTMEKEEYGYHVLARFDPEDRNTRYQFTVEYYGRAASVLTDWDEGGNLIFQTVGGVLIWAGNEE